MTPISSENIIGQLQWRYAVKRFNPTKKVSGRDWDTLSAALALSASSYGLQPWKAYVIQSPELKTKLRAFSWNQPQVEECSHFVVLTGKTDMSEAYINDYIDRTSKIRNLPKEALTAYRDMMLGSLVKGPGSKTIPEWSAKQAYIVLGNLLTTAAMIGVDACPMEGIDPQKYDEVLNLKETGYHTIVACAFGYRSDEDPFSKMTKVRLDKKDVIVSL